MRCYVFLSDESLRFDLQQSAWFLDGRTSTCYIVFAKSTSNPDVKVFGEVNFAVP